MEKHIVKQKKLLATLANTETVAELLEISTSKLYRLQENRHVNALIKQRIQLLAEAIVSSQVRTFTALESMAHVLLDPFLNCKVPKDLELPERLPGILPENVFGFLRSQKVQDSLREGLSLKKEE